MKKKVKYSGYSLIAILIIISSGISLAFPNTSKLITCLITQRLPDSAHISRIRNDLLRQESFINMLVKHEASTVTRYGTTGESSFVKKYIHETPTSMFDIHSFHDFWEVWVRTDIVNGKPLTSFLIRLGLVKDTNAEGFFSNQCSHDFCRTTMKFLLGIYNKMFDLGIFKPIRLNITETDGTSAVSRVRVKLEEWNGMVVKIHEQGKGISFIKFSKTRPQP